eukprot:m.65416 g.65416  ORF g.65416 m.65416 type:complete len:63 (+) comp13539_c0_seq6:1596-1784(+)
MLSLPSADARSSTAGLMEVDEDNPLLPPILLARVIDEDRERHLDVDKSALDIVLILSGQSSF